MLDSHQYKDFIAIIDLCSRSAWILGIFVRNPFRKFKDDIIKDRSDNRTL